MTHKLTVTHDGQTFTRSTNRTYTHVVLVRNDLKKVLDRSALYAPIDKKSFNRLEEIVAGTYQYMNQVNEDEVGRAMFAVQMGFADYNRHLVTEAVKRASADFKPHWYVAGWCGRPDLAQKLRDQELKVAHSVAAEVVIVPVPQP